MNRTSAKPQSPGPKLPRASKADHPGLAQESESCFCQNQPPGVKSMGKIVRFCGLALAALTLLSDPSWAQDTASLTGTIRDKSGAVIAKADIVIKNTTNGFVRQVKSNDAGEYLAAGLPPGEYNLTATTPGFRKYQAEDVTLRVAQIARIDVTLQVGDINIKVTVQGQGLAQVNTQSSEL